MNYGPLFLTFISGSFFLLGFLIVKLIPKKEKLSILAIGMAFIVIIGMILFDFIPEIMELTENLPFEHWQKIGLSIFILILGIFLLKMFDFFLPAHHHAHHENEKSHEEHNNHMLHVGVMMAISLLLHNMIEGVSMYIVACENLSAGILLAVGVGLHNLPLGIEIASNLIGNQKNNKLTFVTMFGLFISTFLGAFLLFFFHISLSDFFLFFFVTLSCGMAIYLLFFELWKEMLNYKKNKFLYFGMMIGIFFLIIMTFLE